MCAKPHFGYSAIEPTLNLFKSLIIIATCVYAIFGAINQLNSGGNPAKYNLAAIYGFISTAGCFMVSYIMFKRSRTYHSELVRVDAKTWLVDGVLSGAILIGFISAWWLTHSPWPHLATIVDPLILIILGISALPIPFKVMLESLLEVIHKAPDTDLIEALRETLKDALSEVDYQTLELRVSKRGRGLYVLVHVIVRTEFEIRTISDLDNIRKQCNQKLKSKYPNITVDLLFVSDPALAV